MQPPTPPKISGVEVEAAQPTEADSAAIALMSADTNWPLPPVAQVVKVRLQSKPPVTSMAWRLYVGDVLIPKYWEYEEGIYFTVLDPQFFSDYKGKELRFSQNGIEFFDAGVKLPASAEPAAASKVERTAGKASKRKPAKASKRKSTKASKRKSTKASKRKAR